MKILLITVLLTFLAQASSGTAAEYPVDKVAEMDLEAAKKERQRITPIMLKAYAPVRQSPRVAQAAVASVSALHKFESAAMKHPEMAEAKKKMEAARGELEAKMVKAEDKQSPGFKELSEKHQKLYADFLEKAEEIPALASLKKSADMMRRIYTQTLDEDLLSVNKEAAPLIDYRKALDKRIAELEKAP